MTEPKLFWIGSVGRQHLCNGKCGKLLQRGSPSIGGFRHRYCLLFGHKLIKDTSNTINKDLEEIGKFLRNQIVNHHSLDNLIKGIIECF